MRTSCPGDRSGYSPPMLQLGIGRIDYRLNLLFGQVTLNNLKMLTRF
jgi:hypothetical protein